MSSANWHAVLPQEGPETIRVLVSKFKGRAWLWPLLIFLLALAIRLVGITYHSLWFDEAVSMQWAEQSATRIVQVGLALHEDKHPPLYYLLLHVWIGLFGDTDAVARSLGVLLGAFMVVPVYRIGQRLAGAATGAVAAILVAFNPFLVWYSQEVRMFVPATTFALIGLDAWLDGLSHPNWRAATLYVLATLAAIYAYLLSALFVPVAFALGVLAWIKCFDPPVSHSQAGFAGRSRLGAMRSRAQGSDLSGIKRHASVPTPQKAENPALSRKPKLLLFACASLAAVTLGFAPLAYQYWRVASAESPAGPPFAGFGALLLRLLEAFLVHGVPWPEMRVAALAWVAVVALILGIVFAPRQLRVFVLTFLLTTLFCFGLMLARNQDLAVANRYLLFLIPGLALGWSGILGLRMEDRGSSFYPPSSILYPPSSILRVIILLSVLATQLAALPHLWTPAQRRENWRWAADYVTVYAGPQDALVLHVDYIRVAFLRYFKRPLALFFPFTGELKDIGQVEPPLRGLQGYDTIWLVQSHTSELDQQNLVERWLRQTYPLMTEQFPTGIRLMGFVARPTYSSLPASAQPPLHAFEATADVALAGCTAQPTVQARDDQAHPPSGYLHVTLYWQARHPLTVDYRPQVRLTDPIGQVWGDALDRADAPLKRLPPTRWPGDQLVRDEQDVNLNPVTPPGEYRVAVTMLDGSSNPARGAAGVCRLVQVVR